MPAYVILHDRVLREIATQRPGTLAALGGISGIGENKLRRFGEASVLTFEGPVEGEHRHKVKVEHETESVGSDGITRITRFSDLAPDDMRAAYAGDDE